MLRSMPETHDRNTKTNPRKAIDAAGKAAFVRRTYKPADELVAQDPEWTWFIEAKTGRYYVTATELAETSDGSDAWW